MCVCVCRIFLSITLFLANIFLLNIHKNLAIPALYIYIYIYI